MIMMLIGIINGILKIFGFEIEMEEIHDDGDPIKLKNNIVRINNSKTKYQIKSIMTAYERYFYYILKELENEYEVIPQLNLASIILKKNNNRYYNELFRNIDFAIFSKNYEKILLLIEINDKTHSQYKRKKRDAKVQQICNNVGISLIKFYSNYPNKPEYVKSRILSELEKNK